MTVLEDFDAELRKITAGTGLEPFYDRILAAARCNISIETVQVEQDEVTMGASRLGGRPDLPPEFEWPYYEQDKPLEFLAQFNLKDLQDYDLLGDLPKEGMLSFFLHTLGPKDPDNARGWKVYHHADTGLRRFVLPKAFDIWNPDAIYIYSPHCSASINLSWGLSDHFGEDEAFHGHQSLLPESLTQSPYGYEPHLLGFFHTIQMNNDLWNSEICKIESRGYSSYGLMQDWLGLNPYAEFTSEQLIQKAELAKIDETWRVLFQIFMDGPTVAFYIQEDALKQANFETIWVVTEID